MMHTSEQPAAGSRTLESHAQEYLTFTLGSEEYGVKILKVQEIRGYERPTAIVNTPGYIWDCCGKPSFNNAIRLT